MKSKIYDYGMKIQEQIEKGERKTSDKEAQRIDSTTTRALALESLTPVLQFVQKKKESVVIILFVTLRSW